MVIRLKNGSLIEIKKIDFNTDKEYYKFIYTLF